MNNNIGILLLIVVLAISNVSSSKEYFNFGDNTTEYHQRADAAIQSFLLHFWNQGAQYINADYPGNSVTQYWNFAQGYDAILDAIERTHCQQYYGWANTFYNTQSKIGFSRNWLDDENWMALALLRAHDLALTQQDTKSASNFLSASTSLLQDIASNWDTSCCGNLKGGIWWDKSHTQKATAANAGPVILAARMYQRTNNQQYLTWAQQWFSFWSTNMVSSSGQIADHFNTDGSVLWWKFTYNNGLMVGAATELYKATKDSKYLSFAHKYASFMVSNMTVGSNYGPVLTDGSSSSCGGDCEEFKGPGYRYLMELYQADPTNSKSILQVLQASALSIWNIARDPSRNLFAVDWVEGLSSSATVSDSQQNVASQALSLWAENYGPYPGTGYPEGQYEAENGELTNVGIEASYAGFTGWGYAAGWGNNGQSISIYFHLNSTSYTITFRYGTGNDASRVVELDGSVVISKQTFPSTGGYGNYNTVSTSRLSGSVGWHKLSIVYDSNQGSASYINLDHLVIGN